MLTYHNKHSKYVSLILLLQKNPRLGLEKHTQERPSPNTNRTDKNPSSAVFATRPRPRREAPPTYLRRARPSATSTQASSELCQPSGADPAGGGPGPEHVSIPASRRRWARA